MILISEDVWGTPFQKLEGSFPIIRNDDLWNDPEKLKDSPVADYNELLKPNVEIKSEVVKFGKGSGKSARSPNHPPGKF